MALQPFPFDKQYNVQSYSPLSPTATRRVYEINLQDAKAGTRVVNAIAYQPGMLVYWTPDASITAQDLQDAFPDPDSFVEGGTTYLNPDPNRFLQLTLVPSEGLQVTHFNLMDSDSYGKFFLVALTGNGIATGTIATSARVYYVTSN